MQHEVSVSVRSYNVPKRTYKLVVSTEELHGIEKLAMTVNRFTYGPEDPTMSVVSTPLKEME